MIRLVIASLLLLVPTAAGQPPAPKETPFVERYHAYWLTPHPAGRDCGDCSQVLLLTRLWVEDIQEMAFPIAEAADRPQGKLAPLLGRPALTFSTYEKDSIWNADGVPFKPLRSFGFLRPKDREVKVNGTNYRYEDAALADVVRQPENPRGTQPIHRVYLPLAGAERTALALRFLIGEQLRDDAKKM
jgi:hypothetical protein